MFDLLSYDFIQNALISGLAIGILLPTIGIIVMLRRMTFIADSFGHINMAGIALALMLTSIFPIFAHMQTLVTLAWTVASAVLIEYLRVRYADYKELSITIVYSSSIALMMIFLSLAGGYNSSLFSILFGNINGISNIDMYVIVISTIVILAIIGAKRKQILLLSLEEDYAKLYGVNTAYTKYLMMILLALAITIAIKAIGVLLVSSLIVIPILAASNWAKTLRQTLVFAILITEGAICVGIFSSFYLNLPTSSLIVIIAIIIYALSSFSKLIGAK